MELVWWVLSATLRSVNFTLCMVGNHRMFGEFLAALCRMDGRKESVMAKYVRKGTGQERWSA